MATVITTPTGLQNVKNDLTADYELYHDIDMSGVAFDPLGGWNGQDPFTGTFDGKGYKIHNLSVSKNGDNYVGLFGATEDDMIQNVTLESPTIHGDDYTGALIGLVYGADTIHNCHVIGGSVIGEDYVGGLFGYTTGNPLITVSDSDATCSVTSDKAAAAIAGNNVGGFLGWGEDTDIDRCHAGGAVIGIGKYVGGFVGYFRTITTIDRCFASGAVETGDYNGDSHCGGFVGYCTDIATNCYARGSVTGTGDYVGGFVGTGYYEDHCYSTGVVTGVGANVGGFGGSSPNAVYCFWDTETSGKATSSGGTGKTTAQMKDVATFQAAEWEISTKWYVLDFCNDGYPCLIRVNSCCEVAAADDQTIIGNKVVLELIRNIEITYGGRFYIDKSGNAVWESRYHRNV